MSLPALIVLAISLVISQPAVAGPTASFGGRADLDFARYFEDRTPLESGADLRRLRLDVGGKLTRRISYYVLADFSDGTYRAQDSWLRYRFGDSEELYAGRVEVPFNLQSVSNSQYLTFLERALPAALSPHYGTGAVYLHKGSRWAWRVGLFGEDRLNFGGTKESGTLAAMRIGRRIALGESRLWLGASAMTQDGAGTERLRTRPESAVTDEYLVNTGRISGFSRSRQVGVEAMWKRDNLSVEGEWIGYSGRRTDDGSLNFSGGYVAASYMINGRRRFNFRKGEWMSPEINGRGAWEVAGRVSWIDLEDRAVTGGNETNFSLGLNYYFNPLNRVMLNWARVRANPNSGGVNESPSFIQIRLQLGF